MLISFSKLQNVGWVKTQTKNLDKIFKNNLPNVEVGNIHLFLSSNRNCWWEEKCLFSLKNILYALKRYFYKIFK